MVSQPDLQTTAIQVLPNVLRSKGNQALKFGQVAQYNRIFFLKSHAENVAGK